MHAGKVALITGATRGIGKACAIRFGRAGFDVVVSGRTVKEGEASLHNPTLATTAGASLPGSLESTQAAVEATGRRALAVAADVMKPEDLDRLVDRVAESFGRVDVLVNNAAYRGPGHVAEQTADTPLWTFEAQFRCNALAPLQLCQRVIPLMRKQGGGVILNITSAAAARDTPKVRQLGYAMSKAALSRMGVALARELRDSGIAVINVSPGGVATERVLLSMGPSHGFSTAGALPMELPADVCVFLATCPSPMYYSGRTVRAPLFAVEHGLARVEDMPTPYGPDSFGLPRDEISVS